MRFSPSSVTVSLWLGELRPFHLNLDDGSRAKTPKELTRPGSFDEPEKESVQNEIWIFFEDLTACCRMDCHCPILALRSPFTNICMKLSPKHQKQL